MSLGHKNSIIFLLFFILMYTSCIHIPCELKSDLIQVDSSVSNQDVIGRYMFDETSLNFSLGKDAGSSKLILNINGTLEIKDFTTL